MTNTYGGRGVTKPGSERPTAELIPSLTSATETIRGYLEKASQYQKLVEASRINFSRVHAVVWNVKVMNVGRMSRESIPYLVTYWQDGIQ